MSVTIASGLSQYPLGLGMHACAKFSDGTLIAVFWNGTNLVYYLSSNNGTSWGSATTVTAVSGITGGVQSHYDLCQNGDTLYGAVMTKPSATWQMLPFKLAYSAGSVTVTTGTAQNVSAFSPATSNPNAGGTELACSWDADHTLFHVGVHAGSSGVQLFAMTTALAVSYSKTGTTVITSGNNAPIVYAGGNIYALGDNGTSCQVYSVSASPSAYGSWSSATTVSSSGTTAHGAVGFLDTTQNPSQPGFVTAGGDLYFISYNGSSWSATKVITGAGNAYGAFVSCNDDTIWAGTVINGTASKYVTRPGAGGTWGSAVTIDAVGDRSSLLLGSQMSGFMLVVYANSTPNAMLSQVFSLPTANSLKAPTQASYKTRIAALAGQQRGKFLTRPALALGGRSKFTTRPALAAAGRGTFLTRPKLAATTRAKFSTRFTAGATGRSKFLTRPLLALVQRGRFLTRAGLALPARAKFRINPALGVTMRARFLTRPKLAATARAKFATRVSALGLGTRARFSTRVPLGLPGRARFIVAQAFVTRARAAFVTRPLLAARGRAAFSTRAALAATARSRFVGRFPLLAPARAKAYIRPALGMAARARFATRTAFAQVARLGFVVRPRLAAQAAARYSTKVRLGATAAPRFWTRVRFAGLPMAARFVTRQAMTSTARSRFAVRFASGLQARSRFLTRPLMGAQARSRWAIRMPLGTPARSRSLTRPALGAQGRATFSTRVTRAAQARARMALRTRLAAQAQAGFKVETGPSLALAVAQVGVVPQLTATFAEVG